MFNRIILTVVLVVAVWVGLNFEYFWKVAKYQFFPETAEKVSALVQEQMEPNLLVIDSLGIKAPISYVGEANEDVFQEALRRGVVHFPGTAKIGEYGNAYFFGHSSDNPWAQGEYKTVFALLPRIKIGDKIVVSDREGNEYVYKVTDARVVAKDDVSVLDQHNNEKKLLTLQTSWPIGTALKRFIAIAELVP